MRGAGEDEGGGQIRKSVLLIQGRASLLIL